MAFEIIATGRAIPAKRVSNDELSQKLDTTDEWIRSHTGICARHYAAAEQATSDLGLEAAKMALSQAAGRDSIDEDAVRSGAAALDLVILCSATPDYHGAPATACIIQDRLGAKKAAAIDVNAGCSGFVYGLEFAAGFLSISKERKRALIIGAEVISRLMNWDDRGSAVLFGDGAGAVLLEKTDSPREGPEKRGLLRSILGADGSGCEAIIRRKGGTRHSYKKGDIIDADSFLKLDGRAVYNFAVKAFTDTLEKLLKEEGISIDDISLILPHQANARILQAAVKRLGISEGKMVINLNEYANTSAASIPIALDELNRQGKLKRGDLLMFLAFGAGLTYGGNLLRW